MEPRDTQETREKLLRDPKRLILWPALIILVIASGVFLIALTHSDNPSTQPFMASSAITAMAVVAVLVLAFIAWPMLRWLFWKHWRPTLVMVACLVGFIALFYAEEDWRGNHAWQNYKRQWEAKGVKFDLASFVPPPVPEDQNFAMNSIVASSYASLLDKNGHELKPHDTNVVNRLSMSLYFNDRSRMTPTNGDWTKGTITDLRQWLFYYTTNEFLVAPDGQSPAEEVLRALSRYDSDIEEVRRASELPYSRFPLEYDKDDPRAIYLPHLGALANCGRMLQLRAIAEAQLNQTVESSADIKLLLHLSAAPQGEPFLISHLVRIRIVNDALQPIYEGLATHKWSDTQLAAFDFELAKLDFLADYQRSMQSEAAYTARVIDYIQRGHNASDFMGAMGGSVSPEEHALDWLCLVSPGGWFHQNQIRLCQFYLDACLPLADMEQRTVFPKAAARAEADLEATINHPGPGNELERVLMSPFKKFNDSYVVVKKFAHGQESVDLARVAIALERYHLVHNQYPESLDALSPQFIAKVPHDIIGGAPLKYRRTNVNFILYSIGWNETDDGGTPSAMQYGSPSDEGDWVWQYPAK